MNYINKSEKINVSKEMIFDLINNVDEYENFLPWCSSSNILSGDDKTMSAEIKISKSLVNWKFTTKNIIQKYKIINLQLIDGPFTHLEGYWKFDEIDKYNTNVTLYLEYKFDNKLIEMSIKPVFSSIMSSILDSFISEAFKLKSNE
jgi:ribosome-associated toxin RatA of RatAB toxin-antitoxin module